MSGNFYAFNKDNIPPTFFRLRLIIYFDDTNFVRHSHCKKDKIVAAKYGKFFLKNR